MKHGKKGHHEEHADESWLLPYSDMMTLLLALFIVMFASSSVDEAKFNAIMESMYTAFGGTQEVGNPIDIGTVGEKTGGEGVEEMTFSDLYAALLNAVSQSAYSDNIEVVNQGSSIVVQFNDSVLFLPDSSVMTDTGSDVLKTIGDIFIDLDKLIGHIEIEGHTAFIGEEADQTVAAWQLSSDRAIVVLQFFAFDMGYDQSKLNTAGYSHFVPVASNDTEEGRAQNRRVELYITPAAGYADEIATAIDPATVQDASERSAEQLVEDQSPGAQSASSGAQQPASSETQAASSETQAASSETQSVSSETQSASTAG